MFDKLNEDAVKEEHKNLIGKWYSRSLRGLTQAQIESKLNLKNYEKTPLDLKAVDEAIEDSNTKELAKYRSKFKIGFNE